MKISRMDAFQHCEELVRAQDKDRYLAALFAPADQRGALFALYAFNAEVAAVRDRVREPMAGEIRLQWWRDALNGERGGRGSANPVAAALIDDDGAARAAGRAPARCRRGACFRPLRRSDADFRGAGRLRAPHVVDGVRSCGADMRREAGYAAERAGLAYGVTALLRAFARPCLAAATVRAGRGAGARGTTPEAIFAGQTSPSFVNALGMMRVARRASMSRRSRRRSRRCRRPRCRRFCPWRWCRTICGRWSGRTTTRFVRRSRSRNGGVSGRCGVRRGATPA